MPQMAAPLAGDIAPQRSSPARLLRRPVAWLLAVAVALPMAILTAGGWLAWQAIWREARVELAREADAAAEYAQRLLLTYSMATSRINDLLQGLDDATITAREPSLHAALHAMVAELPQTPTAFVLDRDGIPLLGASRLPAPRDRPMAADRDFFVALREPEPPTVHVSQVHIGRFDGRTFFAISRRRTGTGNPPQPNGFDGLVNISVEPTVVAEGFRRLIATPGDAISLIRQDGILLARSRVPEGLPARLPADAKFHEVARAGLEQAVITDLSLISREPQLIALRRMAGLPLYTAAIRPRAAILAGWREAMLPQLAIALPAMLALVGLALLVRRSELGLLAANDGLEARVAERTAALARVSAALDLTPCMITDLDGRIEHWSAGCARLYGYSREEAVGQFTSQLLATEFQTGSRKDLLAILLQQGQWQGELWQRRRDGTRIATGTQWTLRRDPHSGQPTGIVSTRTDLSALRQMERELRRSEARLRRAQDASGAVAFEVAEDGTVEADAALPGLFGLPDTTPLTIDRFFARLHQADRELAARLHRQLAREGGGFSEEFHLVWPDGSERWLLVRGEATPNPTGGPLPRLVTGIILDVTERRAAAAALAETGERLQLAQAAAGFGIYDYDFPSGTVTWDIRMRALWALPADVPVTNRLFLAGLHPDDRMLRRDAVRRAMDPTGTGTYQVEYRVIGLLDNAERWVATTGQVRFAGGQPVRLTGLAMDITARKQAEQRNELLMREVDHRAKNALAVVQSALRLSRAETPAELVRIVEGRVRALARAQTILANRRWEGAELQVLLKGELDAFLTGGRAGAPRAELLGPPVTIAAYAAQPLCMAVHELATNAMKYGALSHPGGLLQVAWQLDQATRMLTLTWRESGGPDIAVIPVRRGFGSRVIEKTMQDQLGGSVNRRWLPGGLVCEMTMPLSRTEQHKPLLLDGEPAAAA